MDSHNEYRQAREAAVFFEHSENGKVELTGKDAAKFLHNLSTNDILNLPANSGREAFFCTAKARVVAHVWIYHRLQGAEHSFWLDTVPGQAAALLKHLDFYLISEDVQFADRTSEFAQFHVVGPKAKAVLESSQLMARCDVRAHDLLALPGFDVLCPRDQAAEVKEQLTQTGAGVAGPQTFEILRIEAGTPRFGVDVDAERLVMEVNRTTQAISYTKGCFLGQEPIVMARDRGHLNRLLLGLKLSGGAVPPALKVFRDGQEVGQTTSSVVSPRLGPIVLAYLRRGSWEPGTAVEVEAATDRLPAVVSALPF